MDGVRRSDLVVEGFGEVLDVMQEDDDLIAPSQDEFLNSFSSGDQMNELNFDLSDSMGGVTLADSAENEMDGERVSQPSDSLGLEAKNRSRKCNLRKSLAWDTAFFTSAGVLDPEELSSMIGGSANGGRKVLPGIQEDDLRSSISTLDSDALTLESLEAELFQDIRASIQKSSKAVSTVPACTMLRSSGESHASVTSFTKTDTTSEIKAKLAMSSTPKKFNRTTSASLKTPKQSCPKVIQDKLDERCKMLPNTSGKLNSIPPSPAKRVSMGANRVATEKHVVKRPVGAVRGAPLAKLSASSKPSGIVPRPNTTSKVSVPVSSKGTKTDPDTLRSSAESSSSASSSSIAISSLNPIKMKNAPKTTKPPSSTSTLRIPSRSMSKASNRPVPKTTAQPDNSRLSAYVKPTAANCSSISPASSISDWSIESFSSISTVKIPSGDSKIGTDSNAHTGLSNNSKSDPKTHNSLPHPATAKPSGLRMPSPKIGYFDGVKTLPQRPVQLNFGVSSGLPKGEGRCSPSGGSNNAKIGKMQPRMNSINKKHDAQPAAAVMKPASHLSGKKYPNSSTKKLGSLQVAKVDPSLPSKIENGASPKTGAKNHLITAELTVGIRKEKTQDQCPSQNDSGICKNVGGAHCTGILPAGTDNFHSSFADDSSLLVDNAPPKNDLHKFNSLVDTEEITSDTKLSQPDCSANGVGLGLLRDLVTACDTCNDGKIIDGAHRELEHNKLVNCDSGTPNLPGIFSVTEGSEDCIRTPLANIIAVQENAFVVDSVILTEDTAEKPINMLLLDPVQNEN
uniref:Uncharacterized protein n=1 Tax=Kalanchoe fedtschenkoi TaxID=63787 RepID=A0A7N0RBK0_KALFE